MSTFVSRDVQQGLDAARSHARRQSSRLRARIGAQSLPVIRLWDTGFAVPAEDAPHMRGFVDLYDGERHFLQCLIVASEAEAGEMCYEFKRMTAIVDRPALDFARAPDAPVALIEYGAAN